LNVQVRLAFETAGPLGRARRQGGHLWIGHRASVRGAGALPNSLSPKNAKGGAVMASVCTRASPGCWSILLTHEEFERGRRFRHSTVPGTIQGTIRSGATWRNDVAFPPAKSQDDGLSSPPMLGPFLCRCSGAALVALP
jgi:hypothetical protein